MAEKRKTIDELLEESRKRQNSQSNTTEGSTSRKSIDDLLLAARAPSALEDLNSRLTQYVNNSSSLANDYTSRYFDEDGNYINQYRDDSSDWLDSVRNRNESLSSEADAIKNTLERYKSYISEDSYKEISDMLAANSKALSEIYSHSSTDYNQWSQFGSEDEYKKALAQLEEQEKLRTYDIDLGNKKIEQLKAEIEAKESEALPTYSPEDIDLGEGWMAMDGGYSTEEEARRGVADRLNRQAAMDHDNLIRQLEREIAAEEQYINKAGRVQNAYKLAAVADPESEHYDSDFEYYAQMGESLSVPSMFDEDAYKGGIQNPAKYARENWEANGKPEQWLTNDPNDYKSFNIDTRYLKMTDDEYKTYNYYLAKDSENSRRGQKTNLAEEYFASIEEDLNVRIGIERGENINESGAALQTLFGLLTNAKLSVDNIKNYFSDEDYIPQSVAQTANQVVAEDMANKGWWADTAYQTASVVGNMFPSILVGSLTGGIGSAVGGTIGSVITVGGQVLGSGTVGLSSAGSAYQEMLNLGYNKEQAKTYGTLVGASEATLQYLFGGISSLGGKVSGGAMTKALSKIDNALGRFAVKYAGAVGSEILEEEAQLWIEPFLKSAIFDLDFDAPNIDEMLDTAIITFFSTGLLEGPGIVSGEIGTYKDGKTLKEEGNVDRLVELGKTFSADSVAYELANKIDENTGAYTIGRLLNEVNASLSEQNKTDIKNALIEKGVSEAQAETLAKWMNHVVEGGTLTKKQQMALEANDVLADVLYGTIVQPNSTVMQRGTLYNKLYGIASSMGVDRTALEESQTPEAMTQRLAHKKAVSDELRRGADPRRGLSAEMLAEADNFATKYRTAIPEANYQDVGQSVSKEPSAARIANTEGKVSDTGSAINNATGENVSIKGIASIDTKNKTMMLELADGTKVNSKDISYESEAQAALYESALEMGYTPQVANSIIQGYTPNSNISVEDYLFGTNEAFHYGWGHVPEKGRTGSNYNVLNEAQRQHAVKVGEEARAADDKVREAKAAQNQSQATNKKGKGKYGARVVVSKGITDRVKASVEALDAVAKALKINITVDDLGGNAYGYYKASTNELIIDANAGGNHTLLFTASHELVHYIRNWSPSKFTVLADFLMEQYAAKGEDVDALIQAEINKAYKATRGKHQMTYNEAYEEVVAQAMQGFLTDSNFIERLAALQKKDASLAKRLVSKLKEILNNIRTAYQGVETKDRASQTVKEMGEAIDELYAKMEEGLIAASEASQTIGSRNLEDFSEAKTTDGKDLFQYKAMEEDEETYRQMLKKHGLMSDGEINKLFRTIDNALVIIKNNLEVLDYAWDVDIDDRSFSPVKPNSDNLYKVSLDFSTLCRKRILQQVIQTQLQDALNKPISREESIAIRDELMKIQEEGRQIEIACALCYVESARMKSPAQIKKFLKDRENVIKEFLASKSGGDIKQKIAKAEADARERLGVGNATLKSMPDKIADQIRAAKKEAKKAYTPTAEEQKLIDAAKSMSVTDFTSPEGLANLAKNYPVLFDAYTSFVRNATKSKGIEKDTWWRAGDSASIGDTLIANMNRENGLRSQSWSDFQVIHLLDYIAATIELSTRNAKEQAYSKVPDYIELMGNTGAMLNMSLIPMAKFNGKLEYDSVEGMAYKKALELREKYHATAGTICIGISDEQIKMLLDDSSIDYVIPYHKSGMAAHIRKLMHIPTWSEYEKYQNETNLSRSDALKQAKKYGVKLLSESDENYQKHTAFSEWFDIEEARQIAKQENAFPTDTKLQKKLGVMYGGYMAMQNAANNYLKLCAERGIAPKFSHENANFSEEANYWKLIIDRKMVDNVTGEIIEQKAIKPIFDEAEVLRILNDELERYPNVKADQDYATRTVVEKFLSGKMNDRLDADTIAAIMQKPVDNIATTNIIASEEGVKHQYIDTDSEGNKLTEEQQEFFKDSKVRDENGRLLICYHGTDADFNSFDANFISSDNKLGFGFYFMAGKKLQFSYKYPKTVYLNITNPITDTSRKLTRDAVAAFCEEMGIEKFQFDNDESDLGIYQRLCDSYKGSIGRFLKSAVSLLGIDGVISSERSSAVAFESSQIKLATNTNPTSDPDIRHQYADESLSHRYSYEELTSKPDMKLTLVGGTIPNNRADVVAEAKKNAAKVGKFNPKNGSVSVHVGDIGVDVFLGTDGLKHGLRRKKGLQNSATAIVTLKAGEILKNSIRVNELIPSKENASSSYVLIGAAKSSSGELYVVRFVVNQFSNELTSMDVLYAINAKKELAVLNAPRSTAKPLSVTNSNISIAQLLDFVNNHFPDVLPESVLRHYGYDARPNGELGEDALYQYADVDAIDNRTLLAKSLEGAAKNDIEKTKLKEYQKKIELINAEEKKLRELRAQIKEISFSKGARDTEKLKKLQFEANQAANRINVYDKQLLRLEATKPLMDVVQREKDLVRKKMDQERKAAVKAAKEKDMATIREIMDRHTESRKKAIEGRNKTQMRHKIKNVVGELNQLLLKGTKDKHVMIGLQKAVASALDVVNMDTVGADERVAKYDALIAKANDPDVIASLQETKERIQAQADKMNERLTALKNAYREIKNSKDPLIANSHDEVIESKIESVVASIGDTPLRDMTLAQLEDVYDMYKMVLTTIRNSNKTFKMDKAESISALGNNIMGEIESIAGSKEYTATALEGIKKFGWNSLKPTQAFELIGSGTFKKVFANVRAGEDTWAVDINEARKYYREKTSKYKYDTWDFEKRYDFISKTGKTFSLSLEQIMSLYAYSKRKQADLHLDQGGFVFDEAIEVVEKKKGIPVKYKVNTARAYSISKDALTQIIDKLSEEQKAFVDEMQTYLSEVMGEKGNEVSLEMYGVKLFKEKFYFPLKSAKQFMFEQNEVAGEVRIKNSGFSKETVDHANNPIILSNFMDVWAKHVNDMSMYHAFVLPLEDFNRVFNYKTPTDSNQDTESVKMYLQNAYGTQPVQYIKQLLTDLNGGARVEPNADLINKGIALFKKGAVFASASVVIQQPSAMARAFAYIDPKYFATANTDLRKHSIDWEECKQYAPVAMIKEMGYFDTNVGMQTTDWITAKEYKGFKEKLKGLKDSNYRDEVLSKAPALADELTWTHIWNAVKKEVASTTNLEVGSEAFLKQAGERFTEVIINTQVYDSVLSRSGLMRSKDTGLKMATAFMAEPTTSLNMIVNSVIQAKRGNKKFARKIAGAVVSSIILNSILVSLVYASRDDDEDETYLEKYLGSLTSELLDGFNPITYIPFAKDIWSIAQGYDVERSDMSIYSKLWESFEELFDEKKSVKDKVHDFSGSVATMFGLPLKNIIRDTEAVLNLITNDLGIKDTTGAGIGRSLSDALRNSVPLLGRFYKEDTKAQMLYDAILSGDAKEIARMKAQFKDDKAIQTALRKALRENDERITEAAQARLDGDLEEYESIAREIVSEGHFTQDDVVAAINTAMNKLKDDTEEDDASESKEDNDKLTSYYSASDINASLEKGDTTTALKVIDDIVQVKTENYISDGYKKSEGKKKAEASVKSSVTSYWKPLYLEAKANKDLNEVLRIKKILKATKLYDDVTKTTDEWWVAYKKTQK